MPKRTLEGTRRRKVRTSSFRARMKSASGRNIINNRRRKGRYKLSFLKRKRNKQI